MISPPKLKGLTDLTGALNPNPPPPSVASAEHAGPEGDAGAMSEPTMKELLLFDGYCQPEGGE